MAFQNENIDAINIPVDTTAIDKVRVILGKVNGRGSYGELKKLIQSILLKKGVVIKNKTLDNAICTIKNEKVLIIKSIFFENYLVNKSEDEYNDSYYSSLNINDTVLVQALMDKLIGISSEYSHTYTKKLSLYKDIKDYMNNNGGRCLTYPGENTGPYNLYNKLCWMELIENVSENPVAFKVKRDNKYSSNPPEELHYFSSTENSLLRYFYVIKEYTVEKYNDDNSYSYHFLNIGTARSMSNRYRNHGYHLLRCYEGFHEDINEMEREVKNQFITDRRYNRFNGIVYEQFDNPDNFEDVFTYVDNKANEYNFKDVTSEIQTPKEIATLPQGAIKIDN